MARPYFGEEHHRELNRLLDREEKGESLSPADEDRKCDLLHLYDETMSYYPEGSWEAPDEGDTVSLTSKRF